MDFLFSRSIGNVGKEVLVIKAYRLHYCLNMTCTQDSRSQRNITKINTSDKTNYWQNQENDMCAKWRLRSAQSDWSIRFPHEEALGP